MKFGKMYYFYITVTVLLTALCVAFFYSKVSNVIAVQAICSSRPTVIIDAGHGGVDGGAISVDGILESTINLQLAVKLNDLLHLLGRQTLMIRDGDYSIFTSGTTIAQKKISDLKQRVNLVNSTENSILISIHQNYFNDGRYFGPQVFYSQTPESLTLAKKLQSAFNMDISPESNRKTKAATGIYLMEKVNCCAVLIECGFLSNHSESKKLQENSYQNKLCCVIASIASNHIANMYST